MKNEILDCNPGGQTLKNPSKALDNVSSRT